jgi:hypothetical protein
MLRHFGATVRVTDTPEGRVIELEGQPELTAAPIIVPGDPSSAAFPLVAALVTPGAAVVDPPAAPLPRGLAKPRPAAPACNRPWPAIRHSGVDGFAP